METSRPSSSGKNWVSKWHTQLSSDPYVEKNLRGLPKKELIRIKRKIDALAENLPYPTITKMKENNKFHKIGAGDYRIIYEIHDDTLVVLAANIGHKKDIYRHLPIIS